MSMQVISQPLHTGRHVYAGYISATTHRKTCLCRLYPQLLHTLHFSPFKKSKMKIERGKKIPSFPQFSVPLFISVDLFPILTTPQEQHTLLIPCNSKSHLAIPNHICNVTSCYISHQTTRVTFNHTIVTPNHTV